MRANRLILTLLASAASVLASAALADPPGRVGRVAYLDGDVSFQPPEVDDWSWASRNYPVTAGEAFWTGDEGRAELQVGAVDMRLDNETELDVVALRYGEMRLALPQGSLNLRVWRTPRGGVTIATPAGDVRVDQPGLYRIDVGAPTDDGSYPIVEVTAFEGAAGAPSPDGFATVSSGEAAVLYAGYDPQLQDAQDAAIDDWSRDVEARERWNGGDADALTGYDDLSAAGDFADDPQYGQVWYPRDVPADWAPYRYGHWAYVEPWGYTWIDDQSWGFAPFHYGRWARIDDRWAWIPGQSTPEPVYAPALVAFIGGVGWDVGAGGGAIGWIPLAPDEVYRPSYAVSETYIRNVNITNVRNVTIINNQTTTNATVNAYRNAPAATVVHAAAFSGAAPVQRSAIPVTAAVIAQAPPARIETRPPPTPQARAGGPAPVSMAGRPGPTAPVAARPPARLTAVRAAVTAQPAGTNKPPVIAGARPPSAPPPAPQRATGQPLLVAPAQVHNPSAQNRGPAPAARVPTAPASSPARPRPAPYVPPGETRPVEPERSPASLGAPPGSPAPIPGRRPVTPPGPAAPPPESNATRDEARRQQDLQAQRAMEAERQRSDPDRLRPNASPIPQAAPGRAPTPTARPVAPRPPPASPEQAAAQAKARADAEARRRQQDEGAAPPPRP